MNSRQRSDDRRYGNVKYGRVKRSQYDSPKPHISPRMQSSQNFMGNNQFGMTNQSDFIPNVSQSIDNNLQNNFINYQSEPNFTLWSDNEDFYRDAPSNEPAPFEGAQIEDEPFVSDEYVTLDWYNSDLNLEIDRNNFCGASPISNEGFGYMWAGARANYGALRGKLCYEVIVNSNNNISHLNELNPHILRCGWSIDESGLQLGEEGFSYAYDGTGKSVVSNKFEDYGRSYGPGDVIGCFLDLTSDPVNIGYTLNGEFLGVAFSIKQSQLSGRALFPHICSKNQGFTVNFGQLSEPLMPIIPNYIHIGQLEVNDGLWHGSRAPTRREDCEVLLLIGLPGSGKTFFAEDYKIKNSEKRFNILGISSILDKMACMGVPRKLTQGAEWDNTIRAAVDCLRVLIQIASKRRRNFIFDQANVSPKIRQKKMQAFNGFQRKAFVVIPTDDVYLRRIAKNEMKEGKTIPKDIILTMKANFVLPEAIETMFDAVIYTELGPLESARLVEKYNNEAWQAGYRISKSVEEFVLDSIKYRRMNGINGTIGRIINDMFSNDHKPYTSGNPEPFGYQNLQKMSYPEQGSSFSSSQFSFNNNPQSVRRGDSHQSFNGPTSDSYSMQQQQNNYGMQKKNHPPTKLDRRYSPGKNNDEDSDIEIIKETHFRNQQVRNRDRSPHSRMDRRNFVERGRSRSRSLEISDSRQMNRNIPYSQGKNEFVSNVKDIPSYTNQNYLRRGINYNAPTESSYAYNNKSYNSSSTFGYRIDRKGTDAPKFGDDSSYFTVGENQKDLGRINGGFNATRSLGNGGSLDSFHRLHEEDKYNTKEFYPDHEHRNRDKIRGNKFNPPSQSSVYKGANQFSNPGPSGQSTSSPAVNMGSNSTSHRGSSFMSRSTSDKIGPSFSTSSVVSYPKIKQNNVPPAPHIRPLSEVKVSIPPKSRALPYEGSASYESGPPMISNFKRQGGPTSTPVLPVPPPLGRFAGPRKNTNIAENRNYANSTYPKY